MRFPEDIDEIYRHARLARGWRFQVLAPRYRKVAVAAATSQEDVERLLVALGHTQAIVDARHALN